MYLAVPSWPVYHNSIIPRLIIQKNLTTCDSELEISSFGRANNAISVGACSDCDVMTHARICTVNRRNSSHSHIGISEVVVGLKHCSPYFEQPLVISFHRYYIRNQERKRASKGKVVVDIQ